MTPPVSSRVMDDIVNEVSKLDDATLRKQLISAKIPIGPIVKSTRPIFEKKLVEFRAKEKGVWPKDEQSKPNDVTSISSGHTGTVDGPQTSTPKRTASDSYFVVCIPVAESKPDDSEFVTPSKAVSHLFEDQKEALKLLKKNPGARFKVFRSRRDAESFAGLKANLSTPRSVETERRVERNKAGSKPSSDSPNEFHSPKSQQYVALRKALIGQDKEKFNELVWNNPRYLISSGDTPTILQEGPRYNAVHICAQKDLVDMCSLVLDTLQDTKFVQLMYPGESDTALQKRMAHIVDLYLNVPDKGNNETPLHFACKFGKLAMVKYLLNYPMCDPTCKNRYGQIPAEIICSRCPNDVATKQKIQEALDPPPEAEDYYIPVLRTEDNTSSPQIGQPWSPAASDSQSEQSYDSLRSPIEVDWNIKAFAGPMSPKEASCLYQKWRGRWKGKPDEDASIQRSDDEKGLERIGRKLSLSAGVPWKEYWDFLDEFVDLSTTDGLQKLEKHLAKKYQQAQERTQAHVGSGDDVIQDLNKQFNIMDIHEPTNMDQSKQSHTDNNRNIEDISKHLEENMKMCAMKNFSNSQTYRESRENDSDDEDEVYVNSGRFVSSLITDSASTPKTSSNSMGISQRILSSVLTETTLDTSKNSMGDSVGIDDSERIASSVITDTDNTSKSSSGIDDLCSTFSSLRLSDHSSISDVSGSGEESRNISSKEEESSLLSSDLSTSMPENVFTSPEMNSSSLTLPSRPPDCRFYIIGDKPTRRDMDVYRALQHTQITADFPHVKKWKKQIDAVSDDLRSTWPTPHRRLRRSTSNPALPSTPIVQNNRIFRFSPTSIRNVSPLQQISVPDQQLWSPSISEHSGLPVTRLFAE